MRGRRYLYRLECGLFRRTTGLVLLPVPQRMNRDTAVLSVNGKRSVWKSRTSGHTCNYALAQQLSNISVHMNRDRRISKMSNPPLPSTQLHIVAPATSRPCDGSLLDPCLDLDIAPQTSRHTVSGYLHVDIWLQA
jgi:hypothetical protein